MQMLRWGVGLAVFGAYATGMGCSSSDPSPTPAADAGPTGPSGTPFTVWVYGDQRGGEQSPLEGATVAFDPPGGAEREEVVTDATGKAVVHGDFTKGHGVLTAHIKDHLAITWLHASPAAIEKIPYPPLFGKPKTEMVFVLGWVDPAKDPSVVEAAGVVKGRTETGTQINIGASGGGTDHDGPSNGPWSLRVPKDKPHFIFGGEFKNVAPFPNVENKIHKLFRIDRPAQSANAQLDIDLATVTALPTTIVKQKVEITGGATGPFAGDLTLCFARAFMSGFLVSPVQKETVTGDTVEVENAVVQTDFGETILSVAALQNSTDGSFSAQNIEGPPVEGRVWKDFLPKVAFAIEKQKLTDPIPVDGFPASPTTELALELQANTKTVWFVFRDPQNSPNNNAAAEPLTLPKPPSSFNVPATVQARIVARRDFTPTGGRGFGYPKAVSVSRTLNLEK